MEQGSNLRSSCSNTPMQDSGLEDVNFDAFVNWEPSEATETSVGIQQNKVSALPAGKKRRSNGPAQPRIRRPRIQDSHICHFHQPPSVKSAVRCFGKRSSMGQHKGQHKGTRCERMVATCHVDGQLPVCAQHRAQIIRSIRCEALLECGYPCNQIVPWKPHGYPLCEVHWSKGKCYFSEAPVEIRLLIYQYLIPDQPVQARWFGTRDLRQDGTPVSTAIFRLNKTIHEEFADLFYGQTAFEIDVTNIQDRYTAANPRISMCYSKDERFSLSLRNYDHQMQMTILARLRARTAATRPTPPRPTSQELFARGIKYVLTTWQPSLSLRYFHRIRHFRINVRFDALKVSSSASNSSQTAETIVAEAGRNLLCDDLHRLVERLIRDDQPSLRDLDISIRIQGIPDDDDARANSKAIAHCQALVNPIRRLRSRTASLTFLIRIVDGNREINLLTAHPKEEDSVNEFVQSCCAELTGSLVPPPTSPAVLQFGQLAKVVSQMGQHPFWRETDINEMGILLNHGRSAREANDMKALNSVFHDVFDKLKKYNSDHQDFMKQMKQIYETMRSNGKQG